MIEYPDLVEADDAFNIPKATNENSFLRYHQETIKSYFQAFAIGILEENSRPELIDKMCLEVEILISELFNDDDLVMTVVFTTKFKTMQKVIIKQIIDLADNTNDRV